MKNLMRSIFLFFMLVILLHGTLAQSLSSLNFSWLNFSWTNETLAKNQEFFDKTQEFFSSIYTQLWFWLIIVGIFILIAGDIIIAPLSLSPKVKFWLKYSFRLIGAFLLFVGAIQGEISYAPILSSFIGEGWNYKACEVNFSQISFNENLLDTFSCILTGYTPGNSFDGLLVFYFLGFLAPFIYILYFLYETFDWIEKPLQRKLLTFFTALPVYRAAIAKILIPVLALGITGIIFGIIDITILRIGFSRQRIRLEKEKRAQIEARINQLMEVYNLYLKMGKLEDARNIEKEIEKLKNEI